MRLRRVRSAGCVPPGAGPGSGSASRQAQACSVTANISGPSPRFVTECAPTANGPTGRCPGSGRTFGLSERFDSRGVNRSQKFAHGEQPPARPPRTARRFARGVRIGRRPARGAVRTRGMAATDGRRAARTRGAAPGPVTRGDATERTATDDAAATGRRPPGRDEVPERVRDGPRDPRTDGSLRPAAGQC